MYSLKAAAALDLMARGWLADAVKSLDTFCAAVVEDGADVVIFVV